MLYDVLKDMFPSVIKEYFNSAANIVIVVLDPSLKIIDCNNGLANVLHLSECPVGKSFRTYLQTNADTLFEELQSHTFESRTLSLAGPSTVQNVLRGLIYKSEQGYVLFGGHIFMTNDKIVSHMSRLNNELANMMRELHRKNKELQEANEKIKTLRGLLPICANCKKVRDDDGYWTQIETYISQHSEAQFSHSLCQDCMQQLYPKVYSNIQQKKNRENSSS